MKRALHYYTKDFRILCAQKHIHPIIALGGDSFKTNKTYNKCKNCVNSLTLNQ